MDWLKDKKNQPIVIAGAAVILVIAVIAIIMMNRGGSTQTAGVPGGMPGMPGMPGMGSGPGMPSMGGGSGMPGMGGGPGGKGMPGMGGGMPGMGGGGAMPGMGAGGGMPGMGMGMPGMGGAGTSGAAPGIAAAPSSPIVAEAVVLPVEKSRSDPFAPLGINIPKIVGSRVGPTLKPPIVDFPIKRLFASASDTRREIRLVPDPAQPVRRMAGILLNSRIFAILETNGKFEIVQPGDTLADRLASVDRVERDRVILRTIGKHPRLLTIRMSAGSRDTGGTGMPGNTRSGAPGMGPGGGMGPMMGPGGGMGPGGAMGPMMGPGGGMGPGGAMMPPGAGAGIPM